MSGISQWLARRECLHAQPLAEEGKDERDLDEIDTAKTAGLEAMNPLARYPNCLGELRLPKSGLHAQLPSLAAQSAPHCVRLLDPHRPYTRA